MLAGEPELPCPWACRRTLAVGPPQGSSDAVRRAMPAAAQAPLVRTQLAERGWVQIGPVNRCGSEQCAVFRLGSECCGADWR